MRSLFLLLVLMLSVSDINAKVIFSGICGRQATFTLTDNGVLRISGEGEMFDYEIPGTYIKPGTGSITINPDGTISGDAFVTSEHVAPWVPFNSQIKSIIVGDSITKVGENAFNQSQAASVVLGKSLKRICSYALSSIQIRELIIPDNVTDIDGDAFAYDTELKKIHIGKSLLLDEWGGTPFSNTSSGLFFLR